LSLHGKPTLRYILSHYVPDSALDYCVQLLESKPVGFKVSRARQTKWGDYRFGPAVMPRITVNANLSKEAFLLTLLHEFAHHMVQVEHGRKALPHGQEWKSAFAEITIPLFETDAFGDDLLVILRRHMKNPRATATADPKLYAYFQYGSHPPGEAIKDLKPGDTFVYRGVRYSKGHVVRTRIKCLNTENNRWYLFHPTVRVEQ